MQTSDAIFLRQSIRKYKKTSISKENLDSILNAAKAAPIGRARYNLMLLTVLQNSQIRDEIKSNFDFDPFYEAPVVIIVSSENSKERDKIRIADTACMIENMAIMATDLGLGSVYVWMASKVLNKYKKKLQIPQNFEVISSLALGYADEKLPQRDINQRSFNINYV